MRVDQIIDRLLENGDASIRYRIKKEILGISPDTSEMCEFHLKSVFGEAREYSEL